MFSYCHTSLCDNLTLTVCLFPTISPVQTCWSVLFNCIRYKPIEQKTVYIVYNNEHNENVSIDQEIPHKQVIRKVI